MMGTKFAFSITSITTDCIEGEGEQGPAGGWEAEATEREGGSAGCQGGGKAEGARGGDKEEAGGTEAGGDGAAGDGETAASDGGETRPGTAGSTEVWYPQQPLISAEVIADPSEMTLVC